MPSAPTSKSTRARGDEADPRFLPVATALARVPGFSLMESKSRAMRGMMLNGKSFGMKTAGKKPPGAAATIDDYLAGVPGPKRAALAALRKTIRSIVPRAEECISYRMPAFRLDGRVVAGFCATAKGCSYFPFSGSTLKTLARELKAYGQTKSALHFRPDEPLPASLVKKLIAARVAEKR
jgi:uncharacterized protein YdhG (YjbR/CyaY superfamily)